MRAAGDEVLHMVFLLLLTNGLFETSSKIDTASFLLPCLKYISFLIGLLRISNLLLVYTERER